MYQRSAGDLLFQHLNVDEEGLSGIMIIVITIIFHAFKHKGQKSLHKTCHFKHRVGNSGNHSYFHPQMDILQKTFTLIGNRKQR